MKKLLAVVLGLALVVCVFAAAYLLPYGTGYLAVVLWSLIAGNPSEVLRWTTYWTTGFLLIIVSAVGVSLWKAAYEEVHDWLNK